MCIDAKLSFAVNLVADAGCNFREIRFRRCMSLLLCFSCVIANLRTTVGNVVFEQPETGLVDQQEHGTPSAASPILIFREAERLLKSSDIGNRTRALSLYRAILESSIKETEQNPKSSSISGIALWRLLSNADNISPSWIFPVADKLLRAWDSKWPRRHTVRALLGLSNSTFAGTNLYQFEIEIWHMLATIAWRSEPRNHHRAAVYLFGSKACFSPSAHEYQDEIVSWLRGEDGDLTQDDYRRIDDLSELYGFHPFGSEIKKITNWGKPDILHLWNGEYLADSRLFVLATYPLMAARRSNDYSIRARAGLNLERIGRFIGRTKEERIQLLNEVVVDAEKARDLSLVQSALIRRARVHDQLPNPDFNNSVADLQRIIIDFPASNQAAEAEFLLGRWYDWRDNSRKALKYYSMVSDRRPNRRANEATFRSALVLYANGRINDAIVRLESARNSLRMRQRSRGLGLRERRTYMACLYWLGRMYAESEEEDSRNKSERIFKSLTKLQPYGYYSIRAKMYQNHGSNASKCIVPDSSTREWIKEAYGTTAVRESLTHSNEQETTPRLERLVWSLKSGLFREVFNESQALVSNANIRYNARDPYYLSFSNRLEPLAIWHSLRQDAFSAEGLRKSYRKRVTVANQLARVGDVTTACILLDFFGQKPDEPGYLAALYPAVFVNEIDAAVNAVTREGRIRVPPYLLYGIMLAESRFSLGAISRAGARGLFQFMPKTYEQFMAGISDERRKHLNLTQMDDTDMDEVMSDPQMSITFAAQWFSDLIEKHDGNQLLSIIEHHAGPENVERWFSGNQHRNEIEYTVERARSAETRNFVQTVITNMAISISSGIFRGSLGEQGDCHEIME